MPKGKRKHQNKNKHKKKTVKDPQMPKVPVILNGIKYAISFNRRVILKH